ncbi:GTP-binding protein 8-like [Dreissena polymorpha]|uniref:GTP-binding protein 8 n=1 Tax=Dreissena polymorpha TaxID=45954 RepID=A0A9D4QJT8_DREPO|nr:GTP-binding protein 8-like [Dreissena polymorpha]KAH3834001.1 hypothetical protein DPMN_107319 [Dreissena polymorpha]
MKVCSRCYGLLQNRRRPLLARMFHSLSQGSSFNKHSTHGNINSGITPPKFISQHTISLNPLQNLQKHVSVPILPADKISFSPTEDQIYQGHKLFIPSVTHKIEHLKSAVYEDQLPEHDLPEVAFIGRSNVGKSSLIKAILGEAPEARVRVSKTPGHTKVLNFFTVGKQLCLVDMPGYGFHMPEHYEKSVEGFLSSRKKLSRVIFLVDGTVGVTPTDVTGLNMMEEMSLPYIIVLTKIDKSKPAVLLKNFMSVRKYIDQLPACLQQPFLVSSLTGEGVELLQAFIAHVTGHLDVRTSEEHNH